MNLIVISLHYATFGLVSKDYIIVEAAPISKYSLGRKESDVINYYNRKGAKISIIKIE